MIPRSIIAKFSPIDKSAITLISNNLAVIKDYPQYVFCYVIPILLNIL
jgi:hypothetical protein